MDVATEISALRQWLREDETRLQTAPSQPQGNVAVADERRGYAQFNQFGDVPWNQFNNWGNGG